MVSAFVQSAFSLPDCIDCKEIFNMHKDKVTLQVMSPQADIHHELNYSKHKVHFRCELTLHRESASKLESLWLASVQARIG